MFATGLVHRVPGVGASIGDVFMGVGVAERAMLDAAASARGSLTIEAMCFGSDDAVKALARTLDSGTDVTFLASHLMGPRSFDWAPRPIRDALKADRLRVHVYDRIGRDADVRVAEADRRWQHSKLTVVARPDDTAEAWFSNIAPSPTSHRHADVAVRLLDDTARAAQSVLDATAAAARGGDIAPIGAAIDAAAGAGLIFNDALTGRAHFTTATDALVGGATDRLLLITKGLDDLAVAEGLVAAAERGVRTGLVTKKLGRDAAQTLSGSPVRVAVAPQFAVYDRTNLLIADDAGLLSTGYHSREILRPTRDGMPIGRESAIELRGEGLARVEEALRATDQGIVGTHLISPEPEPLRGWRALVGRMRGTPGSGPAAAFAHPADGDHFLRLDDKRVQRRLVDAIG